MLAGAAGVGKSRLAAEAVRGLGPVQRVVGTRCGAALPFSAFASLRSPGGDAKDAIRELSVALRRPAGQERPLLIVDDAHLLDEGSAALVHHLAVRREVRLVVTVRDGEPAPDAVVALWKDDLLRRIEVPPLGHDDLTRVLESALAGHVEARAVRRLTTIAEGDLRMIRELVRAGALTWRDGAWGWGRPVVDGCVRELLANRLGALEPREWDALTYLAFGAPLAPGTLARLVGPETVERLEAKGLLTGAGGAPYAEIIRAMCGPVRATRMRRTLAAAQPQDAPRAAVWRLDGGLPADPAALAESCRAALAALDVPRALRLSRAATAASATSETSAASGAGAGSEASATLAAGAGSVVPAALEEGPLRALRDEHERITEAVLAGDLTAGPVLGADSEWDVAGGAYCGERARLHRLRGEVRRALASARDGAWRLPARTGPSRRPRPAPRSVPRAGLDTGLNSGLDSRLDTGQRSRPSGETHASRCLGELAHAAALLGDVATARGALAEAVERGGSASAELAAPWAEAAAGDQAAAVRRVFEAAGRATEPEVVLFSLHSAVRLDAAERAAGPLRDLAASGGTLAALFARHADACASDDGGALRAVAREFEVLGMALYAAEAEAQAARAHRRAGDHRQAKAAAANGWTLGRRCEGARTPALAGLTAPELTLRQLEIARLAATGLSNRAIAERLTVSIRTVANHLCGAYERLGVNDRAGLARLLAGLDRVA